MHDGRRALPAQIGMTVVILTIVLLAISLSVTSRVISQAAQEYQRKEATDALNRAESVADGNLGTDEHGNNALTDYDSVDAGAGASVFRGEDDVIFLKKGDTIVVDGNLRDSEYEPVIAWGYPKPAAGSCGSNDPVASLMLTYFISDADGANAHSYVCYIAAQICNAHIATDRSHYYHFKPSETGDYRPLSLPPTSPYYDKDYSDFGSTVWGPGELCGFPELAADQTGKTRIKMVYGSTYLRMGDIAWHRRAAADSGDNEIRVVEQVITDPTAPGIFDFGIFFGNNDED